MFWAFDAVGGILCQAAIKSVFLTVSHIKSLSCYKVILVFIALTDDLSYDYDDDYN